jgi:LuxR family transcriptional regulator, maltose regulon positive regulatory protein
MTAPGPLRKESPSRSVRLKAKWGSPRITNAFVRQRLFQTLDGMTARQCTWLVAPGGYGKTYLLQSYLKSGRRSAIWYNLDEGDSDIATFFDDFSEALETAGHGPLLRLSPDVQHLARFSQLYFQQLAEQLECPALLILDDYHRVAAESGLHEAIAAAIDHLPASIHLIVLSREAPPPAFARAQSHLKIGLIGADELALTGDEALGIARGTAGRQLAEPVVLEACRRVGGWAAGFVILLGQSDPSIVSPESVTTLFHYFEHEVLNLTPDDIRRFLWQTALFQNFSAEMAEGLTGRMDAAAILRELVSGNYFLQVNQSPEPVYHYHDLFRNYLLDYGRRHQAEEWRSTARRAAGILSDIGKPEAAATLYVELADWESLGQLVNRHGGRLLQRGSHRTLARWLSLLPDELKDQQPWLIYWDGCSRLATRPKQARDRLREAFARFVRNGEQPGALLAWAAVCQAYWIAFDDMRPLADWLAELDTLWPGHKPDVPEEIEAQVALGAFLCLIVARPDDPNLAFWESRLMRLLENNRNPDQKSMAATLLLMHQTWMEGDAGRAIMLRDALRVTERSQEVAPITLTAARTWGDSVYEYTFGGASPSSIIEILRTCIDIADRRGTHLYDATMYGAIASFYLSTGQIGQARLTMKRMEKTLNWERTYDAGFYLWLREWEAWLCGRYHEAVEIGHQEHQYASRLGLLHPWVMSHLALAQTTYSLGRRSEALQHLASIGHWSRITRSRIGPCIRGLALAQFAHQGGRKRRTRRLLQITLGLAATEGYLGAPFFRCEDLTALYAEALSAGIQPGYCIRVIRSRELPAPQTMVSAEHWPWRVKVYSLGNFRLELDGETYVSEGKVQQKPLELLKALVALGGEAISQDKLADMLWPEAEGDLAFRNIKTTLNRLRKLLGDHDYLVVREGTLSLNHKHCWTDLWRFTELAREIDTATRFDEGLLPPARLQALVEQLHIAYPHPLLCNSRESWLPAVRQRLHRHYLHCIEKLAHSMERAGAGESAAAARESAVSLQDTGPCLF